MARPNMIVVGTVVLGSLILGVEGYAFYRYHRRRPPESAELERPALRELPPTTPVAALSAAPPVPETSPAEPATGSAADPIAADGGEPEGALRRRQGLLAEHQAEVIRSADEQVFDILGLPDAQRAAIRAIDEAYVHAVHAVDETPPDPNASQTRRAAIADVLGADGMHAFNFQERRAQRRARNQLRPQWVRGL